MLSQAYVCGMTSTKWWRTSSRVRMYGLDRGFGQKHQRGLCRGRGQSAGRRRRQQRALAAARQPQCRRLWAPTRPPRLSRSALRPPDVPVSQKASALIVCKPTGRGSSGHAAFTGHTRRVHSRCAERGSAGHLRQRDATKARESISLHHAGLQIYREHAAQVQSKARRE